MSDWPIPRRCPGQPLDGVRVLDFSTLVPGPLATLLLAEAGADVVKVERPGAGDEMRTYLPRLGTDAANFALLNRGKRSVTADLKDPSARDHVLQLAAQCHILVDQFRPGVMDRLGLGYDHVRHVNPAVVYCSITGYGQDGPDAQRAGHDLNYLAESGLLGLARGADGSPGLPFTVVADLAGGAYPAVMNILLALISARASGTGAHLDVSMSDNVLTLAYGALAEHAARGTWPPPGAALLTGGSPRYNIYATADGRHLAAAPLEDRFWHRFAELIGLSDALRDYDEGDPDAAAQVVRAVADLIASQTAALWVDRFTDLDVCCSVVATSEEAYARFLSDSSPDHRICGDGFDVAALPVPVAPALRGAPRAEGYPALGENGAC